MVLHSQAHNSQTWSRPGVWPVNKLYDVVAATSDILHGLGMKGMQSLKAIHIFNKGQHRGRGDAGGEKGTVPHTLDPPHAMSLQVRESFLNKKILCCFLHGRSYPPELVAPLKACRSEVCSCCCRTCGWVCAAASRCCGWLLLDPPCEPARPPCTAWGLLFSPCCLPQACRPICCWSDTPLDAVGASARGSWLLLGAGCSCCGGC